MQFPVRIGFGPFSLHPHLVFELLAFAIAFRLMKRTLRSDPIPPAQRTAVVVGGLAGALLGAKGLVLLEHRDLLVTNASAAIALLVAGKSVVGALLGGLLGVEFTKAGIGLNRSTGDAFVVPLIVGTAIGRVGCFLTGLGDHTYGIPTDLIWGVDFGDGIHRHPTQLYEILFLFLLWLFLQHCTRRPLPEGLLFKLYFGSYLGFRVLIDFLKPRDALLAGLGAIQIAALLGLLWSLYSVVVSLRQRT